MNASAAPRSSAGADDQRPGRRRPTAASRDAGLVEHAGAGAEHQDRLAVAVLVLEELERPAIGGQASTAASPSGSTTASNSTDGAASTRTSTSIGSPLGRRRPAPSARPDEARHRPVRGQPRAKRAQRLAVDAVGDQDRDAARADAAVAGPGEQRQRRRRRHFRRHLPFSAFGIGCRQLRACRAPPRRLRPAPARRSSGPTPSARGSPASAPATARSGTR